MSSPTNDQTKPPAAEKGRFTGDTVMQDAIAADPNLPMVLMRFHIGGCSFCGFEPGDTVAQVADANGVPLSRLLEALNA